MHQIDNLHLLKKYDKGNHLDPSDVHDIEALQRVGLARSGFARVDGEPIPTAKLTPLGRSIYKTKIISRSPFLKFVYSMLNV